MVHRCPSGLAQMGQDPPFPRSATLSILLASVYAPKESVPKEAALRTVDIRVYVVPLQFVTQRFARSRQNTRHDYQSSES